MQSHSTRVVRSISSSMQFLDSHDLETEPLSTPSQSREDTNSMLRSRSNLTCIRVGQSWGLKYGPSHHLATGRIVSFWVRFKLRLTRFPKKKISAGLMGFSLVGSETMRYMAMQLALGLIRDPPLTHESELRQCDRSRSGQVWI